MQKLCLTEPTADFEAHSSHVTMDQQRPQKSFPQNLRMTEESHSLGVALAHRLESAKTPSLSEMAFHSFKSSVQCQIMEKWCLALEIPLAGDAKG